jgi:hypothetical protein
MHIGGVCDERGARSMGEGGGSAKAEKGHVSRWRIDGWLCY